MSSGLMKAEVHVLIWPDCIPCILRMSLDVGGLASMDESQLRELVREVLNSPYLSGEGCKVTPPEVIRDVWLKIYELTGEADPVKPVKAQENRKALQSYPVAKEVVSKSPDPLLQAVKLAAIGNSLDLMGDAKEEPMREINETLSKFVVDSGAVEALKGRLSKARRLVYLGDNCGEIVFDRLFIEFIRETHDPDVTFVTRTFPVLDDATLQDALTVGMDKVARVMENGISEPLPGTILEKASPQVRGLIEESDLVISKGGGNHDTLTEEESLSGKVSYLVQAKCHPYCTIYQVPLGALIVHNS
jgi:uncharacterized protein with ATP-grasp and redox domains